MIKFLLILCVWIHVYSVAGHAENQGREELWYAFEIDPAGEGVEIQVRQILKKIGPSDCLVEFASIHEGQEIKYQDKCSLFPLPLDDMTFCKAVVVRMGQADTIDYRIGVGASGIQSRKKLIFDLVNNRILDIHYAEGGDSGLEKAENLGAGRYLLPLLEASYVLPGFQGYGPSLYSGYMVDFSEGGIRMTHILNPVSKLDSEAEKHVEHLHSPEWCNFFYKKQMKKYQDALKLVRGLKGPKGKIRKLVDRTKEFCKIK